MVFTMDKVKLSLALLLAVAGVVGFYFFADQALALRVIMVMAGFILAFAVMSFTVPGQHFIGFSREAITETKKVVWPTRKETAQTTGIVILLVILMAVFMWLVDSMLGLAVKHLMGWGG